MRLRHLAVRSAGLAAVALTAVPVPGRAAAPVCQLVRDVLGDTMPGLAAVDVPYDDANLDIVSADVASDRRMLTGAIRLARLDELDHASPAGRVYFLEFEVAIVLRAGSQVGRAGPLRIFLSYVDRAGGPPRIEWGSFSNGRYRVQESARGVLDLAHREVRVFLPLNGPNLRLHDRRLELSNFRAKSFRFVGDPTGQVYDPSGGYLGFLGIDTESYVTVDGDVAESEAFYVGGTPSCVPIGR